MATKLKQTRLAVKRRMMDLAREIHSEVVKRCPIRTGQAKANWHIVDAKQTKSVVPFLVPRKGPWLSRHAAEAKSLDRVGPGALSLGSGPIVVYNPLPYIKRLEQGWSKQAPSGFIRLGKVAALARWRNGLGKKFDSTTWMDRVKLTPTRSTK